MIGNPVSLPSTRWQIRVIRFFAGCRISNARREAHSRLRAPLFLLFNRDGLARLPLVVDCSPLPRWPLPGGMQHAQAWAGSIWRCQPEPNPRPPSETATKAQALRVLACAKRPFWQISPPHPGGAWQAKIHRFAPNSWQPEPMRKHYREPRSLRIDNSYTPHTHNAYICCVCNWSDSCVTPPSTCEPCPNSVT